jgi:hypothetical protein
MALGSTSSSDIRNREYRVRVTSAQIKTAHSIPLALITPTGSNKFFQLVAATAYYHYLTAVYANANLYLTHGGGALSKISDRLNLNGIAYDFLKQWALVDDDGAGGGWPTNLVVGVPIYLYADAAEPTLGSGYLDVYLTYREITV